MHPCDFFCVFRMHISRKTDACEADDMKLIPLATALPNACKSDCPETRGRAGPEVSHFVARPSCWLLERFPNENLYIKRRIQPHDTSL